jgi:hypothetical protein
MHGRAEDENTVCPELIGTSMMEIARGGSI